MWSNVISPTTSPGSSSASEFSQKLVDDDNPEKSATTSPEFPPPPTRYKHSTALLLHHSPKNKPNSSSTSTTASPQPYIYVYGGRSGTFALKDFWELDLNTGIWREIKPPSQTSSNSPPENSWPPRLQEHTLVSANNRLYMFGGECHHNSDTSSHLWVWSREHEDIGWEKIRFKQDAPINNADGSSGKLSGGNNKRGSSNGSSYYYQQQHPQSQPMAPVMRRGHSAVVCEVEGIGVAMVVFGGYRDLKGSLGDCWAYGVSTNTWHLLSSSSTSAQNSSKSSSSSTSPSFWTSILNYWTSGSSSSNNPSSSTSYTNLIQSNGYYKHGLGDNGGATGPHPQPRHNHSAVTYNSRMYVYGGMCDLVELSDFWVFEMESRRWGQIKCLYSPGVLKGAASCVVGGFMYLFGGEGKGGVRIDDVWRFDFVGETFERLQFPGCHPCPRVFASATKLPRRRKPKRHVQLHQPQQQQQPQFPNIQLVQTAANNSSTRRPQPPSNFVKKSTSVVRFADTEHLVKYSDDAGNGGSGVVRHEIVSAKTSPVESNVGGGSGVMLNGMNTSTGGLGTPSCSDYSSMDTIHYIENPNYCKYESFEMRNFGGGGSGNAGSDEIGMPYNNKYYVGGNVPRKSYMCRSIVPQQHPEYVLVIGGLETHKSAVFSKKDLVVWRLRVDCFCVDEEDEDEDEGDDSGVQVGMDRQDEDVSPMLMISSGNGGGVSDGRFSRERSFEVEF